MSETIEQQSPKLQQFIGGQWVAALSGRVESVVDPATEEKVCEVPFGDGEDAKRAIAAANTAFKDWARLTPYQRASNLNAIAHHVRENLERFALVTTSESGKPLRESRGEWAVAADLFDWFAEEGKRAYGRVVPARIPGRRLQVLKQPLGVVGVITAWNFPAYNPARGVAAALAAGCTVVCRPAEETPLSAMLLAEAAEAAKLPPGVLNVVNGDPAAMADAMMQDPTCRKVSFTGSTRVGKLLMKQAAETVTRLALELGGNAPAIVFDDVDIPTVAEGAVAAKFRNAGQVCVAAQRFMVHESVYQQFLQQAQQHVEQLQVGSGVDSKTDVGPLINQRQRDRVEALLEEAKQAGANVLVGGGRPQRPGYFLEPALVVDVPTSSNLWTEETFGPVMIVSSFSSEDEVLASANALQQGLASYLFTSDLNRAIRMYERLEFGMVAVNGWLPHATEAPFPGWKQSGLGAESGPEGLEEYLETKVVSITV